MKPKRLNIVAPGKPGRRIGLLAVCGALALPLPARASVAYSVVVLSGFGGGDVIPYGINNLGQVVGTSETTLSAFNAFVYSGGAAGQYTNLGTLAGGSYDSFAYGINDSGEIVGYSDIIPTGWHAFSYSAGQMHDLGTLGGTYSEASGINNSGQIVGSAETNNNTGNYDGFLYTTSMHDLGTASGFAAQAISPTGVIVGSMNSADGQHIDPAIYSAGGSIDLGNLGGFSGQANAINTAGQIVGYSDSSSNGRQHAFLYNNGVLSDLNVNFGLAISAANDINDSGQIVGWGTDSSGYQEAFIDSNGIVQSLNSLISPATGYNIQVAYAINNSGEIVATGETASDAEEGFLLIPVPEPGMLSIILLPTLYLLRRQRRRP